jgi:alpha-galactosidase
MLDGKRHSPREPRRRLIYTIGNMNPAACDPRGDRPRAYAVRLTEKTGIEGFPPNTSWNKADPIRFDRDWNGENLDPERDTEVRVLWTPEMFFLRFHARYRTLHVFPDARADGWRDELWERDVAEAFLQPDSIDPLRYKEFEVSPNGFWIDLDISHGQKEELHSGLRRCVALDTKGKTWTAEIAVPMKSLTMKFEPTQTWRVNFCRVEGGQEPRFYSAWSPTHSPKPNFHVPGAFGELVFRPS